MYWSTKAIIFLHRGSLYTVLITWKVKGLPNVVVITMLLFGFRCLKSRVECCWPSYLAGFTGIDQEYEKPHNPELRLHAGNMSVDECVQQVVKELQQHVSMANQSCLRLKAKLITFSCILWQYMCSFCNSSMLQLFHVSRKEQALLPH